MASRYCPGHCGHIELPVPVLNPILFSVAYKILRSLCFNCHSFRIKGGVVTFGIIARQLELIQRGLVVEAMNVRADDIAKPLPPWDGKEDMSTLAQSKRNEIMQVAFANVTTRCPCCMAYSPSLTQFQRSRVLARPMDKSIVEKNLARHVRIHANVFEQPSWSSDVSVVGAVADAEDADVIMNNDDDDDENNNNVDDEEKFASVNRWITPLEIKEHFRRAWIRNAQFCKAFWSYLIRRDNDGCLERRPCSPEIFLVECLVVPPSRFRPPGLGMATGRMAEHSQNSHLNRVLSEINDILHEDVGSGAHVTSWAQLQVAVGGFFNATTLSKKVAYAPGVKQVLEKKEGLFRRNMMGKRVNFAARTVISPDPYIETDEIGIPLVFAKKLTFPTPVTWLNRDQMEQAVINGPDVYPGATAVEKDGNVRSLAMLKKDARIALAKTLLEQNPEHPESSAVVHAHVRSGDMVLLNRQPSLHKPSMMGHKVKVLGEERTLRMHYANCNTYNADFDGDEMNIHLPQVLGAKTDLRFVATCRDQYLGPKDGAPLRGLIMDHVLSGVVLTMKDTFFKRGDFQLLFYSAVYAVRPTADLKMLPPAILKPYPLWTGKQVVSAVVMHILEGKPLFNYSGGARIKGDMWGPSGKEEGTVLFRGGELLTGVIDKSQCGSSTNGLIHSCYTLYGGDVAERLLTCLGRLFTKFLQLHGFTCGMDDFIMLKDTEKQRVGILETALKVSEGAAKRFLEVSAATEASRPELMDGLRGRLVKNPADETRLDSVMKEVSHRMTSDIVNMSVPSGMVKPFPRNNFYMMVATGSKGSTVNYSMVSCCLGQMELEGKRVARMASGRTLPSFAPFEVDIVAGGFIGQRFLTGIRPQEFYFHCMAGREGLIDTAVKTSRSGYLQRCIIKHLETLRVAYDGTVRDNDDSVVQFNYGEDGLDPTHHGGVFNLGLWKQNSQVARERLKNAKHLLDRPFHPEVEKYLKEFRTDSNYFAGHKLVQRSNVVAPGGLLERLPSAKLGVVSDRFLSELHSNGAAKDPAFFKMMLLNYMRCQAPPGEAVGVLAGQSIGEPSTQMTLNTFHLAGLGDVNVTLGIPRLRELLMSATRPKIPSMVIPFRSDVSKEEINRVKKVWMNGALSSVVDEVVCSRVLPSGASNAVLTVIYIKFDEQAYSEYGMEWNDIIAVVRDQLSVRLCAAIVKDVKNKRGRSIVTRSSTISVAADMADDADAEDAEDDEGVAEDGARAASDEEDEERAVADVVEKDDEGDGFDGQNQDDFVDKESMAAPSGKFSVATELAGTMDADGFFSESIPSKPDFSKTGIVSLVGIASNEKAKVMRIRVANNLRGTQVLVSSIAERVVQEQNLRTLPGITRCVFSDADAKKPAQLVTEGCNIPFVAKWGHVLDLSQLKCNDIHHMIEVYGIEAARNALVEEIASVFKPYGINVGFRHLSLIADYQTFHGRFRGFNRNKMDSHKNSPLLCMSFETTTQFATSAAIYGRMDDCTAPAAQLCVGILPTVGSGCMSLLQPIEL